jgi:hypothetical protein
MWEFTHLLPLAGTGKDLTPPQLLAWAATQGITVPSASGSVGISWLASIETVFKNLIGFA